MERVNLKKEYTVPALHVKKDIQWMSFDSGAEKSTLAVDRLQSLLQKSPTFEVRYLKCNIKN